MAPVNGFVEMEIVFVVVIIGWGDVRDKYCRQREKIQVGPPDEQATHQIPRVRERYVSPLGSALSSRILYVRCVFFNTQKRMTSSRRPRHVGFSTAMSRYSRAAFVP